MTFLFKRVAIVGLAVALGAAGLAAGAASARGGSTAQWRVVYAPRVQRVLTSVSATGPHDAWASGAVYNGQTLIDEPYVIHWNGLGWHAVSIPRAGGWVTNVVRASSPHNVWVFASYQHRAPYPSGIFRWDGTAWHFAPVPDPVGVGDPVVLSATDVWTSGGTGCTPGCTSPLWHWNGKTWRSFSVGTTVTGLAGTASNDVWAVGLNAMTQQGEVQGNITAFRWNGVHWAAVSMPHPRVDFDPAIGMSSAADVWLGAGITLPHSGGEVAGFAMHWNGSRWQELTAPASLDAFGTVVADGHGGAWLGPMAHWTGRTWAGVTVSAPSGVAWSMDDQSKIPGTSSYWGVGEMILSASSFRPVLWVYGALPR